MAAPGATIQLVACPAAGRLRGPPEVKLVSVRPLAFQVEFQRRGRVRAGKRLPSPVPPFISITRLARHGEGEPRVAVPDQRDQGSGHLPGPCPAAWRCSGR